MPPFNTSIVVVVVFVAVTVAVVCGEGNRVTLTLERANHDGVELSRLADRDRVRHGRFLQQQSTGVVDFSVQGTYDPFITGYIYFLLISLEEIMYV